jgi:sarcosine oxidase
VDAVDFGELRDIPRLAAVLAEVGVNHQVLGPEQARERWPQIGFDTPVLRHAGGVIDAETAVGSLVELAVAAGAELRTGWPVASIQPSTRTGVLLTSATGDRVSADQLVIAAGAWLPGLIGDLVPLPRLRVQQEQVFHFPYQETVSDESRWPTLIHKSAAIQVYGLPGDRDAGFAGQKVAEYFGGRELAGAEQADGVVDPANRERVTGYVRRYLPGLVPEPYAESTCLFTATETEDFVIDRVGSVTILSACSGHGAKFAPLLGRIAADVAEGRPGPAQFTLPVRR